MEPRSPEFDVEPPITVFDAAMEQFSWAAHAMINDRAKQYFLSGPDSETIFLHPQDTPGVHLILERIFEPGSYGALITTSVKIKRISEAGQETYEALPDERVSKGDDTDQIPELLDSRARRALWREIRDAEVIELDH